jgi:hypothetical protein
MPDGMTNIANQPDWRAQRRATELQYDKSVFAAYRDYIQADVAAAKIERTEEWGAAIFKMHEAYRRFVSMPAYSAASIALKLATAIDAEGYGEDVFVDQGSAHAPYAVVAAFIDVATLALKEMALAPEEEVES